MSALFINDVPIECINEAAMAYFVPAQVIISVIETEGGRVGMANRNSNGTYDYGPMQVNSIWLPVIEPYGYTRHQLQHDPCVNVLVGTWILSNKIAETLAQRDNYWKGVAGYHSKTPHLNERYKTKIMTNYEVLSKALSPKQEAEG